MGKVPDADAVAITGRMGGPSGAVPVDPEVGTLSLGYAVHDILKALFDKAATTRVDWFCAIVRAPPLAVKGPTVVGVVGKSTLSPDAGTELGMGTSNAMEPVEAWSVVAP